MSQKEITVRFCGIAVQLEGHFDREPERILVVDDQNAQHRFIRYR